MSFNHEIQQRINQFAEEQAQHYLEEAEMTYLEKLRKKPGRPGTKSAGSWRGSKAAPTRLVRHRMI